MCILAWVSLFLCEDSFQPSSRRLCNMSYVLWQVSMNETVATLFYLIDRVLINYEHNMIIEGINYNQLFYFVGVSHILKII